MSSHQPSPTLPASIESSAPETRSTPSPHAVPQCPINRSGEEESDEPDSEEPDDSDDEDWSDDDGSAGEEDVTGESAESVADVEEDDISINLLDVDLQQCVTNLIRDDACERRCLQGKAGELEWLACSLGQMSKLEKTTCILTLLGVLMQ
ncbi:hypothetical protein PR003_g13973, partial [Phytophthora rubi]